MKSADKHLTCFLRKYLRINTIYTVYLLLFLGLPFLGCFEEHAVFVRPESSSDAISFASPATRASITTLSTLEHDGSGFRVYATLGATPAGWYADGNDNPIDGAPAHNHKYDGTKWGFAPPVFWPLTGYPMNFYALYPSSPTGMGNMTTGFSPLTLQASYTVPALVGNQQDVLTAKVTVAGKPATAKQDITFDHILSMVDFQIISGRGTTPAIQSIALANIGTTRTYNFILNNWVTPQALTGSANYVYYGTVGGGTAVLPTWPASTTTWTADDATPNAIYTATTTPAAAQAHLMLMPQTGSSWTPVRNQNPALITGGYIGLIYRMGTGGAGGVGTPHEVGYAAANQHPQWTAYGGGYTGPLFVKAGFPLPSISPAPAGSFVWEKGNGYNYRIGLGTPNSCNGYILDENYYDDKGNRTNLTLIEVLREGKRVGDKLQDGVIHVTLGVEPWVDQPETPNPPTTIRVTPRYVTLPAAAQSPASQTVSVTCWNSNNQPAPTATWTLRAPATTPQWLWLSLNPNGSNPQTSVTGTGNQTVYIVTTANTGAGFRISDLTIDQYATVVSTVIQDAPNTSGTPPAGVTTYVGAFWRAGETGERIIRIHMGDNSSTQSGNWGPWAAIAAWYDPRWQPASGDGMVLSTDKLDAVSLAARNISFASTAAPFNHPQDAEHPDSKVVSVANVASGTVASGQYIAFRIGLQRAFTFGGPARYATVWLIYGTPAKVQKIFIRQGEGADFLMQPTDAGTGGPWGTPYRPHTVRFSPYNLTDPNANTTTNYSAMTTPATGLTGARGGGFVPYPTQAGYMFQWNTSTRAIHPVLASGGLTNWGSSYGVEFWSEANDETCPPGFRRPRDGAVGVHNTTGPVANSELRQSLWLHPPTGSNENHQNTIEGFYADGFFDRRQLETPPGSSAAASSAVSIANHQVAYRGFLFYNPATNASLFFPFAGRRVYSSNGELRNAGLSGGYWASTSISTSNAWYLYGYNASALDVNIPGLPTSYRPYAWSVRCVQDVCVGLSGVTLSRTGNGSVNIGATAALTVSVTTGSTPTQYAWQLKTGPGANDWETIGMTTSPAFAAPVLMVGANEYRVLVSNGCTVNAPSNAVTVTGIDPGTGGTTSNVSMYIGAFWRAAETGERIIRIHVGAAGNNNAGAWVATVSALDALWHPHAGDGVVLAPGFDADTWRLTRNIDWVYPMTPASAEDYKLTGITNRVVMGNVEANGVIEFRIGLQQNYTGAAPARYGVVTLSYANGTKWQKLFLRQGETPDYVMKNTDAVNSGGLSARTATVRFSPYNLTAETLNQAVSVNGATGQSDPPAIFTEFPTQAGAFWQWGNAGNRVRWAWPLLGNISGWNVQEPVGFWNTLKNTHEVCPIDYRRPNDGRIDQVDSGPTMSESEIRQSLWQFPQSGLGVSNMANSVFGFYADGYFDRRALETPAGSAARANSAVAVAGKVAYYGHLFYNPTTLASLFFPDAGLRQSTSSAAPLQPGGVGYYWTASDYNSVTSWAARFSNTFADVANGIRSHAFTIRCVYAPCAGVSMVTASRIDGGPVNPIMGNTVTLSATVLPVGATTPAYLWQISTDNGYTWQNIMGGTTPVITTAVQVIGSNLYKVTASNACSSDNDVISVTGAAPPPPGGSASRITWEAPSIAYPSGRYVITHDPRDAGLYFKFGSVVGMFSDGGGVTRDLSPPAVPPYYSSDHQFVPGDAVFSPSGVAYTTFASVPFTPTTGVIFIAPPTYHNPATVKAGLGDPCRLVGLNLHYIKNTATGNLTQRDVDNGHWRLPTHAENVAFTGTPSDYWWDHAYGYYPSPFYAVAGSEFPSRGNGGAYRFMPANGAMLDGTISMQGTYSYYWSNESSPVYSDSGRALVFNSSGIYMNNYYTSLGGFGIRCVYVP